MVDNICSLFKYIASEVWSEVSRNNNRGNFIDERGISGLLVISKIQDYIEETGSKKIFSQLAIKESTRGGDLEIYIEHSEGLYCRYFLQAKKLHGDRFYHDITHRVSSSNKYQWDLLLEYAELAGAVPFYLLYNGIKDYRYTGHDCAGVFSESQYGCAISEVNPIKEYCLLNDTRRHPFQINNTPPPVGIPWRCIPCCNYTGNKEIDDLKLYSVDEIDMDASFDNIFKAPPGIAGPPVIEEETDVEKLNEELLAKGWLPQARILISDSDIERQRRTLRLFS